MVLCSWPKFKDYLGWVLVWFLPCCLVTRSGEGYSLCITLKQLHSLLPNTLQNVLACFGVEMFLISVMSTFIRTKATFNLIFQQGILVQLTLVILNLLIWNFSLCRIFFQVPFLLLYNCIDNMTSMSNFFMLKFLLRWS